MYRKLLAALVVLAAFSLAWADAESLSAQDQMSAKVKALLLNGDFDALESLRKLYLDVNKRSPGGTPILGQFYRGLRYAARDARHVGGDEAMEQLLLAWRAKYSGSPTPVIVLATHYLDRAWAYRGEGGPETVGPEQRMQTRKWVEKAHEVLLEPGDAVRDDPEWYPTMYEVLAMYRTGRHQAQSPELAKLVDEGMRRHPYYDWLYYSAAYANSQQWGGSWYQVDDIARSAARNTQDKLGKTLYARVYWDLNGLLPHYGRIFKETAADWKTMREGLEDLVARYPIAANLNAYAFFACNAGDRQTFDAVMKRIGDHVYYPSWGSIEGGGGKEAYEQCAAWTGPLVGNVDRNVRIENMPEPRRTLNMMLAGLGRVSGIYGTIVPVVAFVLGFGLCALGMKRLTAWAIAIAQGPVLVLLFRNGRPGMMAWAMTGALVLPALIGGCGVMLASILVKRHRPTQGTPPNEGLSPGTFAVETEGTAALQRHHEPAQPYDRPK